MNIEENRYNNFKYNENAFRDWLSKKISERTKEPFSASTVTAYVGALRRLDRIIKSIPPVFSVVDIDTYKRVKVKIIRDECYDKANHKNTLSSALIQYEFFLEQNVVRGESRNFYSTINNILVNTSNSCEDDPFPPFKLGIKMHNIVTSEGTEGSDKDVLCWMNIPDYSLKSLTDENVWIFDTLIQGDRNVYCCPVSELKQFLSRPKGREHWNVVLAYREGKLFNGTLTQVKPDDFLQLRRINGGIEYAKQLKKITSTRR